MRRASPAMCFKRKSQANKKVIKNSSEEHQRGSMAAMPARWFRSARDLALALGVARRSCVLRQRRARDPESDDGGAVAAPRRARHRHACRGCCRGRDLDCRDADPELLLSPAGRHVHDCRPAELGGPRHVRRHRRRRQSALVGGAEPDPRSGGQPARSGETLRSESRHPADDRQRGRRCPLSHGTSHEGSISRLSRSAFHRLAAGRSIRVASAIFARSRRDLNATFARLKGGLEYDARAADLRRHCEASVPMIAR